LRQDRAGSPGDTIGDETSLRQWLTQTLARRLKLDPKEIDPEVPFADFGLDSLAAIRLVGDLEEKLGKELDLVLVFEHGTVSELSAHLAREMGWGMQGGPQ
jgi:acyl carrier protein